MFRTLLFRCNVGAAPARARVHAELLSQVMAVVPPDGRWTPLQEVYASLSPACRREHVRPHGSLAAALALLPGLEVQVAQQRVRVATDLPDAPASSDARKSAAASASSPAASSPDPGAAVSFLSMGADFYYFHEAPNIPPPPAGPPRSLSADAPTSAAVLRASRADEGESVTTLSAFASVVPPFFVPLDKVLPLMPGYTEEHFDLYLRRSRAVQLVTLDGTRFFRIFGGYAEIDIGDAAETMAAFAEFAPQPELAKPFVDAFGGVTGRWMPLPLLLQRAGPEARASLLPFEGPHTLLYFAQMQHLFAFSPPEVTDPESTGSVLLKPQPPPPLSCDQSPTPRAFVAALQLLPLSGTVDLAAFTAALPAFALEDIARFFGGSVPDFLRAHDDFALSDDGTVVMRGRYKKRLDRKAMSLEAQLDLAIRSRDKVEIRRIRRKMAQRDAAGSPLTDRDTLARELVGMLPRRGYVTLKVFLSRNVPREMHGFLPIRINNFFRSYPQHFALYEQFHASNWVVGRAGQPPPPNAIRTTFAPEDIIRLVAQVVHRRGPKSCSYISVNLPEGARNDVKKYHGGLYALVTHFPAYFTVVIPSQTDNRLEAAVIHLVKLPPASGPLESVDGLVGGDSPSAAGSGAAATSDNDDDGVDDDDDG